MNEKTERNRVLVVDNDLVARQKTGSVLRLRGFDTGQARSGPDALQKLSEEQFDLVLTSVELPKMTGFELMSNIHMRRPDLPVILMTSFFPGHLRDQAMTWGAADLLPKPVDDKLLVEAVEAALAAARQPVPILLPVEDEEALAA